MSGRTRLVLALSVVVVTALIVFYLSTGTTDNLYGDDKVPTPVIPDGLGALELTSSEQCAACHRAIYDEWKTSHHALAWVNPEPRRKELSDNFRNRDCIPCHAPRPMIEVGYGRRPLERQDRREEGVSCFTCHKYRNVMAAANPLSITAAKAPCHPVEFAPVREMNLCAPCHDQHKVHRDWKQTRYAQDGPSYKDCNDCHMPVVAGPGTVDGSRPTHRSHAFPGAHDATMLRSAGTLDVAVAQLGDGPPTIMIAVRNTGTGHNLPADERHRAVDLEVQPIGVDGTPGSEVRLARFRNPYRDENTQEFLNPFKKRGVPLRKAYRVAGEDVEVVQVRVAADHRPERHEYYPESTQILAGEARGVWFARPPGVGKLRVRLYYKLNPYVPNEDAVVMAEKIIDLESPGDPLAILAPFLGLEAAEEDAVVAAPSVTPEFADARARAIIDETAEGDDRLDVIDGLATNATGAVTDEIAEALLWAMKDKTQQAFAVLPDDSDLGHRVVENPFGGPDTRAEIRWTAIIALERLGVRAALPDLIGALHDRHPVVRNHAARALFRLGSTAGVPVLLQALEGRAFENETANRILREITGQDAGYDTDAGWKNKSTAIERWKTITADLAASTSLPRLGDDARLDRRMRFWVAILGQHQFLFMEQARRALSMLGDLGLDHVEAVLTGEKLAANQQLRAYSVQVLENIGTPRAQDRLRRLLITDDDASVRARAAAALGRTAARAAAPDLLDRLDDPDEGVVVAAIIALSAVGDESAVRPLEIRLANSSVSPRLRLAAAVALARLDPGHTDAVAHVMSVLESPDRFRRADVIVLLEEWQGDRFGYDPDVAPSEQKDVVAAWRERLAKN